MVSLPKPQNVRRNIVKFARDEFTSEHGNLIRRTTTTAFSLPEYDNVFCYVNHCQKSLELKFQMFSTKAAIFSLLQYNRFFTL